ncbi:unnamed protein product [Lampetra fluviatilis]
MPVPDYNLHGSQTTGGGYAWATATMGLATSLSLAVVTMTTHRTDESGIPFCQPWREVAIAGPRLYQLLLRSSPAPTPFAQRSRHVHEQAREQQQRRPASSQRDAFALTAHNSVRVAPPAPTTAYARLRWPGYRRRNFAPCSAPAPSASLPRWEGMEHSKLLGGSMPRETVRGGYGRAFIQQ